MVAKRFREIGRAEDLAYSMVFAALIGGIVGAKLWFVAENGGRLFSGTRLVFYGGPIGGAIAGCARAYYKPQPGPTLVDAVSPPPPAPHPIGRNGCPLSRRRGHGKTR